MNEQEIYVYHSECMCAGWIYEHKLKINNEEINFLLSLIENKKRGDLAIVDESDFNPFKEVDIQYPMNCYPEMLKIKDNAEDENDFYDENHIVAISFCKNGRKYYSYEIRKYVIDNFYRLYGGKIVFNRYWIDINTFPEEFIEIDNKSKTEDDAFIYK